MNAKKLKRKCMVKGCRSADTYSISKAREGGNTIIICKQCLEEAILAVNNYNENTMLLTESEPPQLFYNAEIKHSSGKSTGFICPKCGDEYKSESVLLKHTKTCKKKEGMNVDDI